MSFHFDRREKEREIRSDGEDLASVFFFFCETTATDSDISNEEVYGCLWLYRHEKGKDRYFLFYFIFCLYLIN